MPERDAKGRYLKGHTTGGRPPGQMNYTTESLRKAVLMVFDKIGGIEAFAQWAREEPTEFYKLAGKLIPREVDVTMKDVRPVIIDLATPAEIQASHDEHDVH